MDAGAEMAAEAAEAIGAPTGSLGVDVNDLALLLQQLLWDTCGWALHYTEACAIAHRIIDAQKLEERGGR